MSENSGHLIGEMIAPDSVSGSDLVISNPEWSDIEKAICRLDGSRYCELALVAGEATGMSIVGGWQGRYTCEVISGSKHEANLVNPSGDPASSVSISDDGEEIPETWAVTSDQVLKAARTYTETGRLDETLVWER